MGAGDCEVEYEASPELGRNIGGVGEGRTGFGVWMGGGGAMYGTRG